MGSPPGHDVKITRALAAPSVTNREGHGDALPPVVTSGARLRATFPRS